ncbi:LPXTG cell wall anchor domain-containing protein [Streptomyces sp. uw30]|uniref:LPXTG cell wall anchor domain-containing protein n=1 Tax=Streptomyces sp. uw30 TaxID=1828179 RepID=UPI0011CDE0EE|nr:LPXTG cell wall anchor domain-containing protein [Streptomyces sp. uw30]TXS39739.1 LPXTG cell wall anchor domain-containing protein [Streptomyces sp. uw30]
MKLRRAMAAAAATAVIAPIALLSAPVAFATDETPTPTVSESTPAAEESTPAAEESTPAAEESTPAAEESTPAAEESTPAAEESTPAPETSESSPAPEESTTAPEESETPDPEVSACEDSKVDVSYTGLPGKIAAGSGWHKFSLNVLNDSDSTLEDLDFFAGASPDAEGMELFRSKQVELQAWDPESKVWVTLDEEGYAVGYVGYTDELKPDYEVNIPMRINVKSSAPAGAGFTLGATIYGDADDECVGFGEVAYKFQIVAAGTDTDGTEPQEGGKAPVTDKEPSSNTPEVTGNLAETGSSSNLPVIGTIGGIAIVAGAGIVFAMKRRKVGAEA